MGSVEKITVRLSSETLDLLQQLVDSGEFSSLSDAVHHAVDELIESRRLDISADLPPIAGPQDIEALIRDGDTQLLDEAIRNAVIERVRSKVSSGD